MGSKTHAFRGCGWMFILGILFSAPGVLSAKVSTCAVILNGDDGTELNESLWLQDGVQSSLDRLGRKLSDRYDAGLRFHLDDFDQGEDVAFARLRFASFGGEWTSQASFLIEGVLQDSAAGFSQDDRPSQKRPKTIHKIAWEIDGAWLAGGPKVPLWTSSPDISPVLNEILSLPNWGKGPEGKTVALRIRTLPGSPYEINRVDFCDFHFGKEGLKCPARLEIFRTVHDTFLGAEFLGRITDRSVTVHLHSLLDTDVYIEYGTAPGYNLFQTPCLTDQPAEEPIRIILDELTPDTRYYYRLRYRKAGCGRFEYATERTFHTQRPKGSAFAFAVLADEHLQGMYKLPQNTKEMELYTTALGNVAQGAPDFALSLGDFAHTEFATGRSAADLREATERYLLQRAYLDAAMHSIPFHLVIGNHEGEQGWYYFGGPPCEDPGNLAYLSTCARKAVIPNPQPGAFHSGNPEIMSDAGLREDYFAWEWGDALFVVIAPYWYTRKNPVAHKDGWCWTLGRAQYDWLHDTLHGSTARWKFLFTHQLVSTMTQIVWPYAQPYYGRGGIEVAKYEVNHWPSFEWGGEDAYGNLVFESKRPGWAHGPIHDLLVEEGVSIVFHGHDHFFAKQDLDGIVYQECPQPGDSGYGFGCKTIGGYLNGDFLPNSGHLQVSVGPKKVTVSYVRAFLPGDGQNGEVAFSYTLK